MMSYVVSLLICLFLNGLIFLDKNVSFQKAVDKVS